jgi:molybdate-binding protein/DNA-binding XRE family transcriptional regulator
MTASIRAAREAKGWTQADLATRAQVSRQLITAVEAGRHSPNVAAALSLAEALGSSVEALFSPSPQAASIVGVAHPREGMAVATARVGDRLVGVASHHGTINAEQWSFIDATVRSDGTVDFLPHAETDGLIIAGCDPALGVLASLVERATHHRVLTVHASTGRSIEALAAEQVHGVVVHAMRGSMPSAPVSVSRWHLARWQVGLASARRAGVPTIEEIAERRLRVVQRDPGAGTQLAFSRALRRAGGPKSIPGPVASGHLHAAQQVADGAPAGLTMEAAARSFGLRFTALEEHVVELWIDQRWETLPAVRALINALNSPAFSKRVAMIGGYDLTALGTPVTRVEHAS